MSAVPPNFGAKPLRTHPVREFPILRPDNGGQSVEAYLEANSKVSGHSAPPLLKLPLGSRLRGYFHTLLTKARTNRFLSWLWARMYSSPSQPVTISISSIPRITGFVNFSAQCAPHDSAADFGQTCGKDIEQGMPPTARPTRSTLQPATHWE